MKQTISFLGANLCGILLVIHCYAAFGSDVGLAVLLGVCAVFNWILAIE